MSMIFVVRRLTSLL